MLRIFHIPNNTHILFPESAAPNNFVRVMETGHSFPEAGYSYCAKNRYCYVLHYVVSGRGICAGKPFEGPCGFLFTPNEDHAYSVDASADAPQMEQYWIMIGGYGAKSFIESSGFKGETGIFVVPYMYQALDIFKMLHNTANYVHHQDMLYMTSMLYRLASLHSNSILAENEKKVSKQYIAKAIAFIEENYQLPLKEKDIADAVHISAKYLYKLFKEELEQSPSQYLNTYRIYCAKKLLLGETLSIKEVAVAVGIPDPDYFCRVFQKHSNGVSPTQYRKSRQHLVTLKKADISDIPEEN